MVYDGLLGVRLNAYHWAFSASAVASFSFSASSLNRAFFSMLRVVRLSCRPTACHRKYLLKALTAILHNLRRHFIYTLFYYLFARDDHTQARQDGQCHHDIAGLHTHSVPGSINHLKTENSTVFSLV